MSRLSVLVRQSRERFSRARAGWALRRFAIFDHVPKTGGSAANNALLRIFPPDIVATNRHVDIAAGKLDFAERYPIITGHFGGDWRHRFLRNPDRLAFTVIRDPVSRVISTYSYWRHRILIDHPGYEVPAVRAARMLSFADFIRSDNPALKGELYNKHYSMLAVGNVAEAVREPEAQARHQAKVAALAAEFDVIGTTERLPETLGCFLRAIGLRRQPDVRQLLAQLPKNASPRLDDAEISSADRSFIAERNQLDFELHAIAGARLDRALQPRSWTAIGLWRGG